MDSSIIQKKTSIEGLTADIAAKSNELAIANNNKREALRAIFETTELNPVLLIGRGSVSDAVDRASYLESLELRIESTIAQITTLQNELIARKSELEKQKQELQGLKQDEQVYKNNLDLQKSQKDKLLALTQQEAAAKQKEYQNLQSQIAKISDAIYAQRQKSGNIIYGSSAYPYTSIDQADAWGFATRQCTSYAAWYWNVKLGKKWTNTQPGRGSAKYWPELARTQGYSVSSTPRVGAIISWSGPLFPGDQWGHVAIVESVNSDGTIDISEFNWVKYAFSKRTHVNPGDSGSYSYIY